MKPSAASAAIMLTVMLLVAPTVGATMTDAQRRAVLGEALDAYDRGVAVVRTNPSVARAAFRDAAERFELLVDDGLVNGPLLYNLGNARLQAGDLGGAVLAYRWAERHMPSDPRLQTNLMEARSRCTLQIRPAGTDAILGALLGWHRRTALTTRLAAFAVVWTGFWLGMLAWRRWRGGGWIAVLVATGLGAVVLGASVGADLAGVRGPDEGVVIGDDVVLRKGNGEGFEPVIAEHLGPGVEFEVVDTRGEWREVRLRDGRTGWLPDATVALIPAADARP